MINIDKFICSLFKYKEDERETLKKCLYEQGLKFEDNKIKHIEDVLCLNDYFMNDVKLFTKDKIYKIVNSYYFSNSPDIINYLLLDDNNNERTFKEDEFKKFFIYIYKVKLQK